MKNIELRGRRAQLIKDADSIVASAQAEGRSMTGEEKTKFEAIEVDARLKSVQWYRKEGLLAKLLELILLEVI